MKGKIKFYKESDGWGFVSGEDDVEYYFNVHQIKSFEGVPRMGDPAEFDVETAGKRGKHPRATNLKIFKKQREDDRIICPHCGRRIVPRWRHLQILPFWEVPTGSYCPFCGGNV